jgi:hypothetical protein
LSLIFITAGVRSIAQRRSEDQRSSLASRQGEPS